MSEDLKSIIAATQSNFTENPEAAAVTFFSSSNLVDGLCSEAKMRDHKITVDEPDSMGGTDKGPNPVELILAALGTCQEITYRAYATALGIPLESVSVEMEGDIDLRGFFAVADDVRPGYSKIRGTVHLTSPASDEEIKKLRDMVNAHCPVLDILANPIPVELELSRTG